jgi:hypothetical protein
MQALNIECRLCVGSSAGRVFIVCLSITFHA